MPCLLVDWPSLQDQADLIGFYFTCCYVTSDEIENECFYCVTSVVLIGVVSKKALSGQSSILKTAFVLS